jgi:hypothetical protein
VRLKVDAGPGCGGIAWPAGEVSWRGVGASCRTAKAGQSTATALTGQMYG